VTWRTWRDVLLLVGAALTLLAHVRWAIGRPIY
jgi:hypothetical protein